MLERPPASKAVVASVRPHVRGKFIFAGDEKFYIRGVTYGPFRPAADGNEYHDPRLVERDFVQMAANGLNTIRTYTVPPRWLLDLAQQYGLCILVGLPWQQHIAFLDDKRQTRSIEEQIRTGVRACVGHPAVLGYTIGNEIPTTIVRWHGHHRIERFLLRLYRVAKAEDPDALVTYVNYPSTEYLRLPFFDLFCFNVYLEDQERLEAYLARLQNLAGDRPLLLAEIGLDSRRHGEEAQAEALGWQVRTAFASGCAGSFVFAWTDEWYRGGHDIDDWHFGLTDRSRRPKTALAAVRHAYADVPFPPDLSWPRISVVVCSYNGARTMRDCCDGLLRLDYPDYEVIVVDDGSTDATAAIAGEYGFQVISTPNRGLSSARNVGLAAATGEIVAYLDDDAYPDPHWLRYLAAAFLRTDYVAVGGPNIAPPGDGLIAACIDNAPGNPSHVLVSDQAADHLPGCNLAVRTAALKAIRGFDPQFRIAGDDVDVCWRLQQKGWRLGFSPAAVVWHHRRNSVRAYWRQQLGYGKAEALLERKWPTKYTAVGHMRWSGRVYGKGLTRTLGRVGCIYQGTWGSAPFQALYQSSPGTLRSLPLLPEWYLVILALAAFAALGLLWWPLLLALPLLALAGGVLLVQAGLSAAEAHFTCAPLSRIARIRLWGVTASLHLLQPLGRLWGHVRAGLTPWRRHGRLGNALPRPRTSTIWSKEWKAPEAWLHTIKVALQTAGAYVLHGGAYDHWDLEVRGGLLGSARTRMTVEEHGGGRQLLRFRSWPKSSPLGMMLAFLFAVFAIAAARDQAWTAFTILGLTVALLILRALLECATATAAILSVLRDVGRGGIKLPKLNPPADGHERVTNAREDTDAVAGDPHPARRDERADSAGEDTDAAATDADPARATPRSRANRKQRRAKQRERGTLLEYIPSVLHYVRPYWKLAAASVVVMVLHTLAGLLAPWPLKILIDSVLGSQALPPILTRSFRVLAEDRFTLLVVAVVAGVVIVSVENWLRVINSYTNTRLEQNMVLDFRGDLFQHTQRLSMAYHDKRRSGRLIYAISSQGGAAASLAMTLPPLAQSALTLAGMFWITLQVDRQLALLSLVVVPFLYYSVHYYVTHIQTRLRQVRRMEAESLSTIYEAISMLRVIVAFGREDDEHRRFREQGEQAVDARVGLTVRQTLFSLAINLITAIGTALVLGFGAYRVLEGQLTLGQLLVVISYIAAVYKPLESISYTISAIQERIGGLQTAYEVLHTEPGIKDAPGAVDIARTTGHVTFEGVHFGYTDRVETLKDISFDAPAGQVIAIVGPTGAGKSTLISLIPRFYEPNQGRILLDGHDIRELTLKSLRRQISIVMQEPLLFSGTIADNIGYGRPDATMDEIIEAAKAANAHDFIMRRPEGYESRLGERGVQLSGGERQRISIARAFLKDAPILILDEPTSSLDAKTEAAILRALGRLMVGRTTFVISHRLSAIVHADMILVMDQGELVEQGAHEELLERDGLYAELYRLQTKWMRKKLRPAVESDSEISDETPGRTRKMRKKLRPAVESDSEIGDETPGRRRKRRKKLPPVVVPDTVAAVENQA